MFCNAGIQHPFSLSKLRKRPENGNNKTREMFLFNKSPRFLIVDLSWLDYHCQSDYWFFKKFTPRDIIETVASVPTYVDYSQALWDKIELIFLENELASVDLFSVEIVLETLIELFYNFLYELLPENNTGYIFEKWLDPNSMVLISDDVSII